jgi:hypothetical protein
LFGFKRSPDDLFNSSHLPIDKSNLDTVRVIWRTGKNVFDYASRQLARALILL